MMAASVWRKQMNNTIPRNFYTLPGMPIVRLPHLPVEVKEWDEVQVREAQQILANAKDHYPMNRGSIHVGSIIACFGEGLRDAWGVTEVADIDPEEGTGMAVTGNCVYFLSYFDKWGWLCTGRGNLEAIKKLELFSKEVEGE
jgi:hypothetical protein